MSQSGNGRGGLWWRGVVIGACAGAAVGLLDVVRALAGGGELLQAADTPAVVGFYAGWFAPVGLAAVVVARVFAWPRRALHLLVGVAAAFFFVGTWLNVSALPGFTSGLSIAADVVLVVLAALWFRRRYRGTGTDTVHLGFWLGTGVAAVAVAFALAELVPPRDAGAPPEASAAPDSERPNVLVVLADTLRADHLGAYGYAKATSPEIDEFARDAVLFEDCRSPTSWTKPAVASLFTSLYPSAHACVEQREVLVPEAETLAEVFRAAGWRTAAFSDNPFVSPEFGLGQGFDAYDYVRPSVVVNGTLLGKALFMTRVMSLVGKPFGVGERVDRGSPELFRNLAAWIDRQGDRPWFAYVHAMEPHLPYEPPREEAERFGLPRGAPFATPPAYNGILPFETTPKPPDALLQALVAQYDGEVRQFSRAFGSLLGELRRRGALERTVVVLTADHGEEFHEHGGWTHGHSLHREVVQVPLVVRLPDGLGEAARAGRGRRVAGLATLLDLFPTVLEACGVRYPRGAEHLRSGASLVPQLAGRDGKKPSDALPLDRVVLGEVTMRPVSLRSIREGRWLLVVAKEPLREAVALWDDVSDPGHKRERMEAHALEARDLRPKLDAAFGALERAALTSGSREIDPETGERLRRLGYVGGR